ncbi:MAG: hypothetical protein IT228_07980 [Flavobacteriales bacterium]|nr:hypothetical protein [Flavobacteriales bacterium]
MTHARIQPDHPLCSYSVLRTTLYVQHRVVSDGPHRLGNNLWGYTCVMPFSSRDLPDTLALTFSGQDPLTSVITFRIIDRRGKEIHKETVELLKQEELLEDGTIQRLLIALRARTYFQDERFHYPPISAEHDRTNANDAHTCSFTYPVNDQESRTILYDRSKQRVVVLGSGDK